MDLWVHIVEHPDSGVSVAGRKNPSQPTANETGTAGDENVIIGHDDINF
jgi:hypothetical protein